MDNMIGLIKIADCEDAGLLVLDLKIINEKIRDKILIAIYKTLFEVKGSWDNWYKKYGVYSKIINYEDKEVIIWFTYWKHCKFDFTKKYYYKFIQDNKWFEQKDHPANNWINESPDNNGLWNRYFIPYIGEINIELSNELNEFSCMNDNFYQLCDICNPKVEYTDYEDDGEENVYKDLHP